MNNNQILQASLLDIVFDGRNKDYGAYDLRATYSKRINTALSLAALLVAVFVSIVSFAGGKKSNSDDKMEITAVVIDPYEDPIEDIVEPPPPPRAPETPPAERIEQFSDILMVDEENVDPPPTQEELSNAIVGLEDKEGIDATGTVIPAEVELRGVIEAPRQTEERDDPFIKVEKEAEFPGGIQEWLKFLERNCNGQVASDNNAPEGRYTVIIRFIVDKEGNVSDLEPITQHGHGMEAEAMRVIKLAGKKKWRPAIQNGLQVKAYRSQPITFQVQQDY